MPTDPLAVEVVCPFPQHDPDRIGDDVTCGFCGLWFSEQPGRGPATLVPGSRAALLMEVGRATIEHQREWDDRTGTATERMRAAAEAAQRLVDAVDAYRAAMEGETDG